MGLPISRNTNYSPGATPVSAVDMNSIQDVLVALNNLVTGQPNGFWTNVVFAGALTTARCTSFHRTFWPKLINSAAWAEGSIGIGAGAPGTTTSAGIASEPRGYYSTSTGGARFSIPFEDGDTLTGLSIELRGDGVHGSTLEIDWHPTMANTVTGSGTAIGSWNVAVHASGFVTNTATVTPTALSAGNMLYVWLSAGGAGLAFGPVVATFNRVL